MWLKNTSGNEDAILTLSVVTLGVVLLKFFLSEMSFGSIVFGQLDGAVIAALLTPTIGGYCIRRYTDSNAPKGDDNEK